MAHKFLGNQVPSGGTEGERGRGEKRVSGVDEVASPRTDDKNVNFHRIVEKFCEGCVYSRDFHVTSQADVSHLRATLAQASIKVNLKFP